MKQITSQMFKEDNGTVKEKLPKEMVAAILRLANNDPADFKLGGQRANLILIRRFANKLSKSI
jgi:hypothetical protein